MPLWPVMKWIHWIDAYRAAGLDVKNTQLNWHVQAFGFSARNTIYRPVPELLIRLDLIISSIYMTV